MASNEMKIMIIPKAKPVKVGVYFKMETRTTYETNFINNLKEIEIKKPEPFRGCCLQYSTIVTVTTNEVIKPEK